VTPRQLAKNRRYAVLVIAVVAMLLPGTDPVTMLLCMAPLYLLFELSLLLARRFGQPADETGIEEPHPAAGRG
jgi:sec-independent protein translocase protein TatC